MIFEELKRYLNAEYAASRDKWLKRNSYYYQDVVRMLRYAVPENSKVLEVSFDNGWLLNALLPSRGVHLGLSPVMNQKGREAFPNFTFVDEVSFEKVPLQETFDYVILHNVIGMTDDLQTYFTRFLKVSGPRTRVIVTYYNYLWEPIIKLGEILRLKQRQPIQNWLSVEDVAGLLDLAGFDIIREGRRLLFPKYVPLLSWFLNRVVGRLPLFDRLCFWNYVIARPKPEFGSVKEYSVSVVVPARNEKEMIEAAAERLPQMGKWTEIIFIEGGSTDGTWDEILRVSEKYGSSKKIKYARQDGKGKGEAVRQGFSMADGDILMILDADLTVPPEDLSKFYQVLASGQGEYVHGSRLVYPMEKQAMRFLNLLANKFFGLTFSWLLKRRIKDTLCGTKVISKSDYELLSKNRRYFGEFDPFGDFDLIFGAHRLNLKMVELPVRYRERIYGTTNISRFRHGWLLLRMCWFAAKKLE